MTMDIEHLKSAMDKTVEALKKEFAGVRTGRAHAGLLDSIRVDLYGTLSPLSQVATISVPESRTLAIQVWDNSMIKSVEKAITESNLGLSPIGEGQNIRIHLPELSEERRRELVKVVSKYAEASRVSVRNLRREGMDHVKKSEKDGDISKDDAHRMGTEIQKITDDHTKKVDDLFTHKEQDIMQI